MRSSQVLARKNRNVINIALAVQQETLPALAPQIGVASLRYGSFALVALESISALEGLKTRCLHEAFSGVRTCFKGLIRLLLGPYKAILQSPIRAFRVLEAFGC